MRCFRLAICCGGLVLASCAGQTPKTTGGLDLPLQPSQYPGTLVYRAPDIPSGKYKSIFVDNADIYRSADADFGGASEEDKTRLAEKLTVRETIELFASFYRRPRSTKEVLAELGLAEKSDSWVGKLSGGQRQRLAVATALVANPRILFLDEPTTGLDPQSRRQLWEVIHDFQRHGGTVLLTTHYMDEAERLCDRLAIIDYGRIIAEGSPTELIERLGGQHMVEFAVTNPHANSGRGAVNPEIWRKLPGVEAVHGDDGLICLTVHQPHVTIPALLETIARQGAHLTQLNTRQASLEDVFLRLTGRHLREDA